MNLDDRLKEAGMMTIPEMKKQLLNNPFMANTGVVDINSFRGWLHMRHKEMAEMHARMTLDKNEDDEMYAWVLSHSAVLSEVLANLEKALSHMEIIKEKE